MARIETSVFIPLKHVGSSLGTSFDEFLQT